MRIKAVLQYDGSNYFGFQVQSSKDEKSIQGEIETVLSKIFNTSIRISASGRTDKGVHALKQVMHFDVDSLNSDLNRIKYSMNLMLPKDINIISLERVDDSFHSRYSATGKHYRYIISLKDNPFLINHALIYHFPIDIDLIKEGMKLFIGTHNFINFCSIRDFDTNFEENIKDFTLTQKDELLIFDIYGSGFKRYMVRMIIGTLLMLGRKKIDLSYINEHLNGNIKDPIPYKVDPQGLYLVEVFYD